MKFIKMNGINGNDWSRAKECEIVWDDQARAVRAVAPDTQMVLAEMIHARVTNIRSDGLWIVGMERIKRDGISYQRQEWRLTFADEK